MDAEINNTMAYLDFIAMELIRHVNVAFALKGGYVLSKLLENPRATRDIDLSTESREDYEEFQAVLAQVGEVLQREGVADSYFVKEIDGKASGGADYYKGNHKIFGVDISFHPLNQGIDTLELSFGKAKKWMVERMLADKITALLSQKRFRRIKDFYDLNCLIAAFDVDYALTRNLLDERLAGQEELWDNIPYSDEVLAQCGHAWDKLQLTSVFTGENLAKQPFGQVCGNFYRFVQPLKYREVFARWKHTMGRWE